MVIARLPALAIVTSNYLAICYCAPPESGQLQAGQRRMQTGQFQVAIEWCSYIPIRVLQYICGIRIYS